MDRVSLIERDDCVRLTNGTIDVVAAARLGPRILRYGFTGGANMFGFFPELSTATALGEWRPWGGHRLWAAPEMMPASYAPDNDPIEIDAVGDRWMTLRRQKDEAGIGKRMTVTIDADSTRVVVEHEIVNQSGWPIRVAPWALTVVAPGGRAFVPLPRRKSHSEALQAACPLVLWSFTDLTDPRWSIGSQLIRLTPDAARMEPQKLGIGNRRGWCAFVRRDGEHDVVFIKRFDDEPHAAYPDDGANNEFYAEGTYMEIETLGPLRVLEPGAGATHTERWYLFRDVAIDDAEGRAADQLAALAARTS